MLSIVLPRLAGENNARDNRKMNFNNARDNRKMNFKHSK